MSNESCEEGLKIYVTSRGGQYVKAEELLANPEVREIIKKWHRFPLSGSHLARLRVSRTNYFSEKDHPNSQLNIS